MRVKSRFIQKALPRRFVQGEQGMAAVEFALVLPIVFLLMLGCFEVPRYVMIVQKINRAASGVGDLIAQADEPLQRNQITDIFEAAKIMMEPYDIVADGKIYVSSINNPAGAGVALTWQRDNGGTYNVPSKITSGNVASNGIPLDLRPASNEEVLATEVFFDYVPFFGTIIYDGAELYRVNYSRPRNKNLMTPPPLVCPGGVTQC
jgi:Flp pilus assembly protein TadG